MNQSYNTVVIKRICRRAEGVLNGVNGVVALRVGDLKFEFQYCLDIFPLLVEIYNTYVMTAGVLSVPCNMGSNTVSL